MGEIRLAKRLGAFPEYIFAQLIKRVAEVEKETGRKVLDFSVGSPDIRPSASYLNKFAEFVGENDSHLYPEYRGTDEFNEAVIGWYKKRFGVDLSADEIFPVLGAKDGVSHLPLALADSGDEILVPDPGYPAFLGPALMFGINPVSYDLLATDNFKISLEDLKSKLTNRTKFIWVNFPANPTGAVASVEELGELVEFAKQSDVLIVYDNPYSEITFDGYIAPSILQVPGAKDIAVEIGSFSKTFSFAGFRMGWIVGNRKIVDAIAKVKSQFDPGMSFPLQRLGAFALSNQDMEWHKNMIATYQKRRNIIAEKLKALGLEFTMPKGALYVWAKIPDSSTNSEEYCINLLKEKQVLFTPGSAFGKNGERYVRVSICADVEHINEYF